MTRFLVCRPLHFGVQYDINPWMTPHVGTADGRGARRQWLALVEVLHRHGAALHIMNGQPRTLPDLVFTANAALVLDGSAVLACFAHPQRQAETPYYRRALQSAGLAVDDRFVRAGLPFEGAGDALPTAQGHLVVGWGFRSHRDAVRLLERDIWGGRVLGVRLVDPRFYHLGTCFCPLADGKALWHPAAFCAESQQRLRALLGASFIEVTAEEAAAFTCNAVQVGRTLVAHHWSRRLSRLLEACGYAVVSVALDEFIKAGGSAECLTLRLA